MSAPPGRGGRLACLRGSQRRKVLPSHHPGAAQAEGLGRLARPRGSFPSPRALPVSQLHPPRGSGLGDGAGGARLGPPHLHMGPWVPGTGASCPREEPLSGTCPLPPRGGFAPAAQPWPRRPWCWAPGFHVGGRSHSEVTVHAVSEPRLCGVRVAAVSRAGSGSVGLGVTAPAPRAWGFQRCQE